MLVKSESIGNFTINFYAEPEYMSLTDYCDDTDDTEEQIEETLQKIERGELVYFCAKVTAVLCGIELASEYLGTCLYETYEQFCELDSEEYSYMKQTVMDKARTQINDLIVLSEMEL